MARVVGAALFLLLTPNAQAAVEVRIKGVDDTLAGNIRQHLRIQRYAETPGLSETNVRALHAAAPEEIADASAPYGYYQPEVDAELRAEGTDWIATYTVRPGTPVRVTAVSVSIEGEGSNEPALLAIRDAPGIAVGQVLRHSRYEALKTRLLEAALSRGFRDVSFSRSRLEVDRTAHAARIELVLVTGTRYLFGEVNFSPGVIREDLMRRYAGFKPGDPYDASKLIDLQYALFDSQYFSTVQVRPQPPEEGRVPISVTTQPAAKRKISTGVGFGTDTGPRLSLGYVNRRLNTRGHRFSADLALSSELNSAEIQYVKPLDRPATDRLSYALGASDETLGDTRSELYEVGATHIRQLGSWQRRTYLSFSRELNETSGVEERSSLLVPGVTWTRSRSNAVTFPTRGSLIQFDAHGAVEGLISDTSFLQLRLDTRLIRPSVGKDRVILRLSAGTSLVNEFGDLPASERFFTGGYGSVRGFGLNELGPVDEDGQVIGGKHLLTASAEYERRLFGNWALGIFVDWGNAFDGLDESFEYSAGIGLRWLSPIGMVRLDIAEPLSNDDEDLGIHFSFGPEL